MEARAPVGVRNAKNSDQATNNVKTDGLRGQGCDEFWMPYVACVVVLNDQQVAGFCGTGKTG
jgi:hypothetical protein